MNTYSYKLFVLVPLSVIFVLGHLNYSILSDRKAFFSLCSLLIDREKVKMAAMDSTLSCDNFLDFIPAEKHALVHTWMRWVLCFCHEYPACVIIIFSGMWLQIPQVWLWLWMRWLRSMRAMAGWDVMRQLARCFSLIVHVIIDGRKMILYYSFDFFIAFMLNCRCGRYRCRLG